MHAANKRCEESDPSESNSANKKIKTYWHPFNLNSSFDLDQLGIPHGERGGEGRTAAAAAATTNIKL